MKSIKYNIVETTDPKQNVLQSIQKVQNKLARLLNHSKLIDRINSRTLFDNLNSMLSVNQINAQIKIAEAWKSTKMSKYPISANALRTCLRGMSFDISFDEVHRICKKCTPSQILLYNQSLQLHKTVNHQDFPGTFEDVTIVDQIICTGRQLKFRIYRNNHLKIGLNTSANKLHCLSNQISLDMLNLTYVHFKKLAKIQFLKFGKT